MEYKIYKVLEASKSKLKIQDVDKTQAPFNFCTVNYTHNLNLLLILDESQNMVQPQSSKYNSILREYRFSKLFTRLIADSPHAAQYEKMRHSLPFTEICKQIYKLNDTVVIKKLAPYAKRGFKAKFNYTKVIDFKPTLLDLQNSLPANITLRYSQDNEFIMEGTYNRYIQKPYKYLSSILEPYVEYVKNLKVYQK